MSDLKDMLSAFRAGELRTLKRVRADTQLLMRVRGALR